MSYRPATLADPGPSLSSSSACPVAHFDHGCYYRWLGLVPICERNGLVRRELSSDNTRIGALSRNWTAGGSGSGWAGPSGLSAGGRWTRIAAFWATQWREYGKTPVLLYIMLFATFAVGYFDKKCDMIVN